jgi:hypothetical protein
MRKKPPKVVPCIGCEAQFALAKNMTRPICPACRKDPKMRSKALWKYEQKRLEERIDKQALKDTRNLPRKDAFTPVIGEAIILKMMRGEW